MLDWTRVWARIVGLGVVATLAGAATQLLSIGFGMTPLVSEGNLRAIVDWILRSPQPGAGILIAVVLCVAGLAALLGALSPRRGPAAITIRRETGWTRIDRKSLAAAIQRELETIDRRSDIDTRVHRSGKVDVGVTAGDVGSDGPATDVRVALDELCSERNLPCQPGTVTVRNLRPSVAKRRRVR